MLQCGEYGHVKSECPKKEEARFADEEEEETAHLTFHSVLVEKDDVTEFQEGDNYFQDDDKEMESMQLEPEIFHADQRQISTEQAVLQGKAIIDGGATRTMASMHAMEHLMTNMKKEVGRGGVKSIGVKEADRPTFGFGNSQKARCLSTCTMEIPNREKTLDLKVHVLGEGRASVLLSVDSLRKMGAIIDFANDDVIFTKVNPRTLIHLERSTSGHQLLPLTKDFISEGKTLPRPVKDLRQLALRSHIFGSGLQDHE